MGDQGAVVPLSVSFNQDCSCVACGTTTGFRVFTNDPFKETVSGLVSAQPMLLMELKFAALNQNIKLVLLCLFPCCSIAEALTMEGLALLRCCSAATSLPSWEEDLLQNTRPQR
jgi:hypothetical protein